MTATLCLIGVTLCWGITPVLLKYLAGPNRVPDGFTSNLVRYPLAVALYLPLLIAAIRRGGYGRFWLAALIPTTVNVLGQTLWAWAPYYLESGMMSFIGRTAVIWGILGAFVLFPDERRLARSLAFWVGTVLSIGGFVMMSLLGDGLGERNTWFGIAIMMLCAACWGLYGVTVRYVIHDLHPLFVFSVIGGYTAIAMILLAPLGEPAALRAMPAAGWVVLVASAVLGIAIAHGLYYVALQRIGAAISTLSLMMAPFVTIAVSAVVLNERFTHWQWVGGVILIVGASAAVWSQHRVRIRVPPDPHELGTE